uniref:Putative 8 kDa amblyomma family n=1 Tax=Rhipicephalus pulchellus TaxID=72859 RepID=L7M9E2_RHIPC
MTLIFLILMVVITNKISGWPGPPSGYGEMKYCGNSCHVRRDGSSDECKTPCRCITLDFSRNVFHGRGNCFREEWH